MKIGIVNEEQSGTKWEIEIDKFDKIESIRTKIGQYLNEKDNNFLIYKNIILQNENLISFYKICSNDEIWWGKIENYLKCDDVVIDIFLVWRSCGLLINVIVNDVDSIADVKSILDRILIYDDIIVDIWNDCGTLMRDNQIISDIHRSTGERRIICRLDDGDIDRSFDECCDIYDGYLMDQVWKYRYYFNLWKSRDVTSAGKHERKIHFVKQVLLSIVSVYNFVDIRLQFTSSLVVLLLLLLCCMSILIFYHDLILPCLLIWYFRDTKEMVQYLLDDFNIGLSLINLNKLFIKYREQEWVIDKLHDKHRSHIITLLHASSHVDVIIPHDTETIREARLAISLQTGATLQQIYLIDNECDTKPKDEDTIDDSWSLRYLCQIVQSMDDIDILRRIGRGSYGEVLLCQDKISQDLFVLKRPIGNGSLDREIIIHSIIDGSSSKICRHRGLFSYQESICSAIDYKSGGTLGKFIKKRKCLQEHEIARISHQILIQIKDMHNRGVIHRDIKPDNIVLDEDNNVYLIDFGISKYANNMGHGQLIEIVNKSSPGTAHYMAPELASDDVVTEKIDTWSFGVMVIEMVNGETPYHDLTGHKAIRTIIKERKINFDLPQSTTEELKNFINCCVQYDPIKRVTIDESIQSNFIGKYCN